MFPDLKSQFFLDPNIIFLNHGSFGSCAKPVYEDLLEWQRKLEKEPVKFFEETIFEERLFFLIALAIEEPINPHPIIQTFLNII